MKNPLAMIGATVVGLMGVLTLHGPSGQSAPAVKSSAPPTTQPSSSSGSSPTTTLASGGGATGTAVGQVENYGYGQMAVTVTVANNRIVGLKVSTLSTLESYSQQLEQQVVPILKSEVLQAQGTRISALSGATYTSEAYAYSIQSALDKLHFK